MTSLLLFQGQDDFDEADVEEVSRQAVMPSHSCYILTGIIEQFLSE